MSEDEVHVKPPTGQVTLLFTDVQGSSAAWENHADEMAEAMAEHDRRLRRAVGEHDGYIFTTAGDSFAVAFGRAADGLRTAIAAQQLLAEPAPGPEILVRMALHTGTTYERDGDYFGPVVNRCARLMSAGHGGQILVSGRTAELLDGHLSGEVQLIDLGEHQLKDLSRPERVYQVVHPALGAHYPKLRTLDASLSNLPIQLTSFIGRDRELAEVAKLFAESRLLTLAGPGGSGKTRLAMQLAAEAIDELPGGVALVELAPINDPDLVSDMVAATFGASAQPGTPLVDSIVAKVGAQEILLLVDNCEHLLDPVGQLVKQLLTRIPGLKVLATSQAPLGIPGELVYRVPSLTVPDVGTAAADALRFDAITLFVERAIVAQPAFELTAENGPAVIDICRQLDGIPLALELAAARVAILTPEQIDRRLGKRFRLLAGGPRLSDVRHRTLQTAIEWSHDLLDDSEKAMFRRCGVFAGTFDLDAVEVICPGGPIDEYDALDLVAALADKSLLVVETENDSTRYRLLESMRRFALDRLDESGERTTLAAAHAAYFAGHAEALQRFYRNSQLADALDGMRLDRDNMRAAIEFGFGSGDLEVAARIIGGVGYLWYVDGAFREGVEWCARFFAFDPDLTPSLMASALHSYDLLVSWAEPETGAEILEREIALRRQLDEPVRLAAALNNLGLTYNDLGRRKQGDAALLEAVDLYRASGKSPAMPINALATGHMNDGDFERAMDYCEQALDEARRSQDAYDLALASATIGACAAHLGRFDEARPYLEEARERYTDLGVSPGVQEAELHLALVDRAEGRTSDAACRVATFLDDPDSHWHLAAKYWALQVAASLIGDDGLGAELLGVADAYYESAGKVAAAGVRPAWVRADFEATRRVLAEGLGDDFEAHFRARLGGPTTTVIETARRRLRAMTKQAGSAHSDTVAAVSEEAGRGATP